MDSENFGRVVKVPTCLAVRDRRDKRLSNASKKSQSLSRHQGRISSSKTAITAAKSMPAKQANQPDQKRRLTTFLDVVSESYLGNAAASLPRRFSQCDMRSASDEFKSVMEDLKGKEKKNEDLNTTSALTKLSKNCQVFCGRERKSQNAPDLSSEFQLALGLRRRRRLYTFPARNSEMRVLAEDPLRAKEKETHPLPEMAIGSNIKLAWQNGEKVKLRSLSNPPRGLYFKNKRQGKDLNQRITTERFERDIITAPRIVTDTLHRRDIRPKITTKEMLQSEKGVLAASLLNKRCVATFHESKGNVNAAGQLTWRVITNLRGSDNLSTCILQTDLTPSNDRADGTTVDIEIKHKRCSAFFSDGSYSTSQNLPVNLRADSENRQQPHLKLAANHPRFDSTL